MARDSFQGTRPCYFNGLGSLWEKRFVAFRHYTFRSLRLNLERFLRVTASFAKGNNCVNLIFRERYWRNLLLSLDNNLTNLTLLLILNFSRWQRLKKKTAKPLVNETQSPSNISRREEKKKGGERSGKILSEEAYIREIIRGVATRSSYRTWQSVGRNGGEGVEGYKSEGRVKRGEREIRTRSTRRVVTFSPGL